MARYKITVPYVAEEKLRRYEFQDDKISLCAAEDVEIKPHERTIIKTGLQVAVPTGFEMQVKRDDASEKGRQLYITNEPGTVDSDYRGEIGVIVENTHPWTIKIKKGDRIARGVFAKVEQAHLVEKNSDETNAVVVSLDEGAQMPFYATSGAAGLDLCAAEGVTIEPGYCWVQTGVSIKHMPESLKCQIRSRSGMAKNKGIKAMADTIRSNNAEIQQINVLLYNTSSENVGIEKGSRIAQLVFSPSEETLVKVEMQKVDVLDETTRGARGFGSTGVKRKK